MKTALLTTILVTSLAVADEPKVVDLSLLVSADHPSVWPVGMTPFMRSLTHTLELDGVQRDQILIDEHTGTQWDAPAHFMPPSDSGLDNAGPNGDVTSEKVEPWKFLGEACVIDVREQALAAKPGTSYAIPAKVVKAWEQENRELRAGDIVAFRADYSDRYYKPFPAGDRYTRDVLDGKAHAWAGPTPECVDYLAEKGVYSFVTDGPSLGPVPDLPVPTHVAAAKHGMIGTEAATGLGSLPVTGSLYVLLAAKHAGGSGGEARALAITERGLAGKLIERVREKRVADLSVLLHDDYPVTWPGFGNGHEAARYFSKTLNAFHEARGPYFARTHVLDSQVGTHVVPSSFVLPTWGWFRHRLPDTVREWLSRYEKDRGRLRGWGQTADRIPLEALQGRARVIDMRWIEGTTQATNWPASPRITADHVKAYETRHGKLNPGEVVLLFTAFVDRHFKPIPGATNLMAEPLAGRREGWPAVDLDALDYLKERGIVCVGIDTPTAGGVEPEHAQRVYWHAARRGVHLVEFLTNLKRIAREKDPYFLFAPIKIRDANGGYGRALAVY